MAANLLEAVEPTEGRARVRCAPRDGEARHSEDMFEWHDDVECGEVVLVMKHELAEALMADIMAARSVDGGDPRAKLDDLEQRPTMLQQHSLTTRPPHVDIAL